MPPLDPFTARQEVEMLQQVLRGTQSEFDALQRETVVARRLRELRHQSWRARR